MKKLLGMSSLTLVAGLYFCSIGVAQTYDLTLGFSATENPNGVWSYGWSASRGSEFIPCDQPIEITSCGGPLVGWVAFGGDGGIVSPAYAVGEWNCGEIVPVGTLNLHPGPAGQNSVIRWTAPASGGYTIEGWFDANYPWTTSTDVAVIHATTVLFNGNIEGENQRLAYSFTRQVSQGDTIDFTVGYGNGNYNADATGIGATISRLGLDVTIDIKPGSFPNSINLSSAGVIPVAILSSPTFDATQVNPTTVSLAGAKVKLIGKGDSYSCNAEDVNGDGLLDSVCHVMTAEFMIEPGDSVAVLEAITFGGQAIRGEDSIRVVPQ